MKHLLIKKHLYRYGSLLFLLLLVVLPVFMGSYFRMQSSSLSFLDTFAEQQIINFYQQQIAQEVAKSAAYLPREKQQELVQQQLAQFIAQNQASIQLQAKDLAERFKAQYRDENNDTYLLAIDPYLQYQYTLNYLKTGTAGDVVKGDKYYVSLRGGRFLREEGFRGHPWLLAQWYKLLHFFSPSISVMRAVFLFPVFIMALAILVAFFLGRRISRGNLGGFLAALWVAVHPSLIGRTAAGFSDTDAYNAFFPLFVVWLLVEGYEAKSMQKKIFFGLASSLAVALYSIIWQGFWFTHVFLLAALGGYVLYLFLHYMKTHKTFSAFFHQKTFKEAFALLVSYVLGSFVFMISLRTFVGLGSFLQNIVFYFNTLLSPFNFIRYKEVAITSIWPNVLTTVAELNLISLPRIIDLMGGKLVFFFALLGIVFTYYKVKEQHSTFEYGFFAAIILWYTILVGSYASIDSLILFLFLLWVPLLIAYVFAFFRKDFKVNLFYPLVLTIFFTGTLYAATRGVRFTALHVLFVALAIAVSAQKLFALTRKLARLIDLHPDVAQAIIIVPLLLVFLYVPNILSNGWTQAQHEVPSFNDAWYDILTTIKTQSKDAIITSWWDFGHWFYSMSQRKVTFDGGDQGKRIHWVGKVLLTDNETEAVNILRMLNCGQNKAYESLLNITHNDYQAIQMVYDLLPLSRSAAQEYLKQYDFNDEQIQQVLQYTHCTDLLDQWFIASQDMVGKSGVWAHFGSWNFTRAYVYNRVRNNKSKTFAIPFIMEHLNVSQYDADRLYREILTKSGDQWVTGWPSYMNAPAVCRAVKNDPQRLQCANGIALDLATMDAYAATPQGKQYPVAFSYEENDTIKVKYYQNNLFPQRIGVIFYHHQGQPFVMLASPELVASLFTKMFFFEGKGLKYFTLVKKQRGVDGQAIYLYQLDWEKTKSWWDH